MVKLKDLDIASYERPTETPFRISNLLRNGLVKDKFWYIGTKLKLVYWISPTSEYPMLQLKSVIHYLLYLENMQDDVVKCTYIGHKQDHLALRIQVNSKVR
ncbi:unnamed protein product [Musa textilis]